MSDVVVGALALVGGLVGSGVASWVTLRTARADRAQRRAEADADRLERRREEWGRRFSTALERLTSENPATSEVGQALLEELLASELASEDDRREAQRVLNAIVRGGRPELRLVPPPLPDDMDDVTVVEDTDHDSDGPDGSGS